MVYVVILKCDYVGKSYGLGENIANVTMLIKVMVYVNILKCDYFDKSYDLCENIEMWLFW